MIHTYQNPLSGEKVGIVFGTFAPLHQGHLDLIMRAKKECDGGCIVIVDGRDGDRGGKEMPLKLRYRYVREFFADDDLVAVYPVNETELGIEPYPNGWDKFITEVEKIFDIAADGSAVFYVSEDEYHKHLTDLGYDVVLLDRTENPISATMIRENPIKHWDKITYSHEYARDYMQESNVSEWELDGADYMAFLDGQYQMNKKLINSPSNQGIFFADSDSMTTRMYAEYYSKDSELELTESEFEEISVAADAITKKCRWDKIYLLCPHGVFVDDHTRYMACGEMKERQELFDILCQNIKSSGNWDKVEILDGGYWSNFNKIVNDVKEIMNNGKVD